MMNMTDEILTEAENVHSDGLGILKLHLELNMEYADEVDRQILKKIRFNETIHIQRHSGSI